MIPISLINEGTRFSNLLDRVIRSMRGFHYFSARMFCTFSFLGHSSGIWRTEFYGPEEEGASRERNR